jgi:hypothetical protein
VAGCRPPRAAEKCACSQVVIGSARRGEVRRASTAAPDANFLKYAVSSAAAAAAAQLRCSCLCAHCISAMGPPAAALMRAPQSCCHMHKSQSRAGLRASLCAESRWGSRTLKSGAHACCRCRGANSYEVVFLGGCIGCARVTCAARPRLCSARFACLGQIAAPCPERLCGPCTHRAPLFTSF